MNAEGSVVREFGGDRISKTTGTGASGGLDSPTGQYVNIPSGINQKIIRYFIPDPLGDLLSRCEKPASCSIPPAAEFHAAALLHLVARRGYAGSSDLEQAGLLFDLIWQAPTIRTIEDLLMIATRANGRTHDIRRQIVFTGSLVASDAVHVYAPHEAVPDLMDQLIEGIQLNTDDVSIVDKVAVLGFFGLHAHPFRDGNGRWIRALTMAVERRSTVWTMAAMSFQTICMRSLAENIWPLTRAQGLRDYLSRCNTYADQLMKRYKQSEAHQCMERTQNALRKAANNTHAFRAISKRLFLNGEIHADETKRLLGASSRVVDGLFHALEDCGLTISQGSVSISNLQNGISECSNASVAMALDNMDEEMQ